MEPVELLTTVYKNAINKVKRCGMELFIVNCLNEISKEEYHYIELIYPKRDANTEWKDKTTSQLLRDKHQNFICNAFCLFLLPMKRKVFSFLKSSISNLRLIP